MDTDKNNYWPRLHFCSCRVSTTDRMPATDIITVYTWQEKIVSGWPTQLLYYYTDR